MTEEKGKKSVAGWLIFGLIAVMLAVGVGVFATLFMPDYLRRGRQSDLAQEGGAQAPARILSVTETGRWYAKKPVLQFAMQVTPIGAPAFNILLEQEISLMQVAQFKPGLVVQVRYNPAKPEQAVIVNQTAPAGP